MTHKDHIHTTAAQMSQRVTQPLAGSAAVDTESTKVTDSSRKHGAVKPYSMRGDNYTAWCKYCEAETTWGFGIGCLTCMSEHLEGA